MPRPSDRARQLRHEATDVERLLWAKLCDRQLRGAKFRRQAPIGSYVVDFVCFQYKLVVELDGGQHREDDVEERKRTRFLVSDGFWVLRFWNNEVLENSDGVLETISAALRSPSP